MTTVQIGNATAIEGYRDPDSDEPDRVRFRELPGQRTTTVQLPDDMNIVEAAQTVILSLGNHMLADTRPVWIECDVPMLRTYLCAHFGLAESSTRPAEWGSDLVAPQEATPKKKAAKRAAS
jgi:hypothetical protein